METRPHGEVLAVDNGIWLAGLVYGGSAEELIKLGITGRVSLVTCESLLEELVQILRDVLLFSEAAIEQVRVFIDECAEILRDVGSVAHLNGHRAVPAAGPFLQHPVLELATRSQATAIATTERSPLTSLGDWQGIPIIPMA